MKLKTLLLTSMLFAKTLFASHDAYVPVYIPISDMSVDSGIKLHKVLFYTYYAHPESVIDSVTWSYKANTPHERYKDLESNLAHIEGLTVSFKYKEENGCDITIDSRSVVSNDETGDLNIILKYVKKATVLNMKNAKLNCKIITKTAPKKITHFSPKALDLSKVNVEVFKKNIFNSSYVPFVQDTIYPLGYSNDGKFAYIIEHDNDPADFVSMETVIQDLVTDKIIWSNSFRDEHDTNPADFKTFWKKRQYLIEKQLSAFKIKPLKDTILTTGVHLFSFDQFTLSSKVATHYEKDWSSNFLDVSSIYIHSKKQGQKTINEKNYNKDSHVLARKPMGFFASEENYKRVAILVGTVSRGWEGPPHNLSYEIIGANLSMGFNK